MNASVSGAHASRVLSLASSPKTSGKSVVTASSGSGSARTPSAAHESLDRLANISKPRQTRALPGIFLAQATLPEGFKPFASPYAIPFLPLWVVILLTVLATLLFVALIWWLRKRWKKANTPPTPPRQAALNSLNHLQPHIESDAPTEFTVEVASVLRRFVVGQYGIPATRQTSQEFLQSLTQSSAFSEADQLLLKSFLDKSDLIEFARLNATSQDNRELWEKARQFVAGSQPETGGPVR